jgi:triosephosphate isomerase
MKGFQALDPLTLRAKELGFAVYGVTASAENEVAEFRNNIQPPYDFCTADETTLKTILRSNPGVLLLHEGTVIGKWNFRDVPEAGKLRTDLLSVVLLERQKQHNHLTIIMLSAIGLWLYGFLLGSGKGLLNKKKG